MLVNISWEALHPICVWLIDEAWNVTKVNAHARRETTIPDKH